MLIDTSGLFCLLHAGEPGHAQAVALYESATVRLTHSYVIAEFVTLAQVRGLYRQSVLDAIADLQQCQDVMTVYVDRALHVTALSLLQQRLDKTWSLCDAVSFILMQRFGITQALTTDHHFEQAGFVRLLLSQ